MSVQFDLSDQTAVVTGASRGIGAAIAAQLAQAGARVIGTATSEAGAARIGESLGERGEGQVLDVCDVAAVEAFCKAHSGAQILVNNAGVTRDTLLLRMKDEDWSAVLDTDLTGIFRLSRGLLRGMMKARHGRIISVGSVVGAMGNPGQANYCAAKAGLVGFSKALAREVGSRGITVNVVAPGFIDTDMTRELPEDTRAKLVEQIPAARLGAAEDIAAAVCWLASAQAGYITGETLHVNGGMHMV